MRGCFGSVFVLINLCTYTLDHLLTPIMYSGATDTCLILIQGNDGNCVSHEHIYKLYIALCMIVFVFVYCM